jgi:hypothetical protein
MSTCLEIDRKNRRRSPRLSRADALYRWTTEGKRSLARIQGKPVYIHTRSNSLLCRNSWFGGYGEHTGYTPAKVNTIIAGESAFRHGTVYGVIEHFKGRFACVGATRACQILRALGSGDDVIYWQGSELTSNQLFEQVPYLNRRTAVEVYPVDFFGGPPNKWCTYRGSLLTFMLDRIAVTTLLGGLAALDNIIDFEERYTKFT